jgi:hypothetical protein
MPDPHLLQGSAMKNVHACFLLSVSLVAASLQLLIYTESAVCEAVSAEGSNPNSSVLLGACSFVYSTVPLAAPSLCSKCSDSCNFLDLLLQFLNVCGLIKFAN